MVVRTAEKEQLEKLTEELQRVQAEREALEKQREERREAAQMREQEEMQRSEEYFSNAAAELSKRLTDGKPCPVCGYQYGHAWQTEEVPQEVIDWLFNLPESPVVPAWV